MSQEVFLRIRSPGKVQRKRRPFQWHLICSEIFRTSKLKVLTRNTAESTLESNVPFQLSNRKKVGCLTLTHNCCIQVWSCFLLNAHRSSQYPRPKYTTRPYFDLLRFLLPLRPSNGAKTWLFQRQQCRKNIRCGLGGGLPCFQLVKAGDRGKRFWIT